MLLTTDHSCLNYTGRVVYNYYIQQRKNAPYEIHKKDHWVRTSTPKIKIQLGPEHNVFRVDHENEPHGNAKRSFSIRVQKISDIIVAKRWVDKSIIKEIELLGETIGGATYSNSFALGALVTSNIEIHYFSKHKCHVTHISSLGAYSSIDFTCFDSINNTELQQICAEKSTDVNNPRSVNLSQIISLFFCETSRNPSAFLTFPMCLELAEKIYSFLNEDEGEQKIKDTLNGIHNVSTTYQELLTRQQNLNLSSQEQRKITKEINSEFIDLTAEDIAATPKSQGSQGYNMQFISSFYEKCCASK